MWVGFSNCPRGGKAKDRAHLGKGNDAAKRKDLAYDFKTRSEAKRNEGEALLRDASGLRKGRIGKLIG